METTQWNDLRERYSDFKKIIATQYSEENWCPIHGCYNCKHRGRRGYTWLPNEIIRAMKVYTQERLKMGHKVEPMHPHDVWVYMRGELPHIQTMRKHMNQLTEALELVRVGVRGGYLLPEYVHVTNNGHLN